MTDDLRRLAREAAPAVLTEAMTRAREQAVDRLVDLLTEAIVAEALARSAPEAPHHGDALYAYGITPAGLPLPGGTPGLTDGAGIERVTAGDLALLVSRVRPEDLQLDEDDLSENGRLATLARGHDAVVRAAAAGGPVLPLRFGTVVPDEQAARRLLTEHADAAGHRLRRIGDAREWGVKLVRRVDEPIVAGRRPGERVNGTEYLARRRQALHDREATERSAAEAADLVEEHLRPHVRESLHRGGSPGSSLLLDLAFLVPPERETGFLAAAAELREKLQPDGLEVEVSGPWPCYSFATLEHAEQGAAGA